MATRYIGNARLTITYSDRRGDYRVVIIAGPTLALRETVFVRPPAARRGYGVDNPKAYDEAAHAAASFAEKDDVQYALASGFGESGWIVRRTPPARRNPCSCHHVVRCTRKNPMPPMSKQAPSAKLLLKQFGHDLSEKDARILNRAMRVAGNPKLVYNVLNLINRKIHAYGVESIEGTKVRHPSYAETGVVALYVNTGDVYNATVLYNTVTRSFQVTTVGDFVEHNERRYGIR